jgi:hypothetical protein
MESVVSVRRELHQQATQGLVYALVLLAAVVAVRPDAKALAVYGLFELVSALYAVGKAFVRFRRSVRASEPLPYDTVEATPRPTGILRAAGLTAAAVALLVAFSHSLWVLQFVCGLIAIVVAALCIQPLAELYLLSRWERFHGRLFRPLDASEDDDVPLYVADHAVPAA